MNYESTLNDDRVVQDEQDNKMNITQDFVLAYAYGKAVDKRETERRKKCQTGMAYKLKK